MNKKKKLNHTKMRTAYYETGDKLPELLVQSKVIGDEELIQLAKEMKEKLEQFRQILDDKYIWD